MLIKDEDNQSVAISSKKVKLAHEQNVSVPLQLDEPELWSLNDPNLYTAHFTVKLNGEEI